MSDAGSVWYSTAGDPLKWDSDCVGAIRCKSPEDAKKAAALFNEMQALIERLQAEKAAMESKYDAVSDALDYLRGLTPQQYEALHKDAARYRWLANLEHWSYTPRPMRQVRASWLCHLTREELDAILDAAIDSAMRD